MYSNAATPAPSRGRGRPRDAQLRERILVAAARLAAEEGIDIGFDRISQASGASRTTLYRWWSSPQELLLDALLDASEFSPERDSTLPTVERLRSHLENTAAMLIDDDTGVPLRALAAVAAGRENARIAFVEHWLKPRRDAARALVIAGIAEGEIVDEDPDVLVDVLLAPIYHRAVLLGAPLTEEFISGLMRRVRR
ncbi:TetR/AcrR family transcriptional regulator C-terminal ligand-binding domain-containing protein [Microbacterium sp.]|uniref:TetR/AcrR family transcriptional regulator n=1 Tax=Microbacterium sp. TaxID=51671 RepID=UPI003C77DCAF